MVRLLTCFPSHLWWEVLVFLSPKGFNPLTFRVIPALL